MARWRYLPGFERRKRARSEDDLTLGRRLRKLTGLVWALCAIIVVAYLVAALSGLIEPAEEVVITLTALVAAVLWLGHAVLVLYRSTPVGPDDDVEEPVEDRNSS